jgi:hypothetical protein
MHQMLSFSISYSDLITFLYFADTIEKGGLSWKEAQRQGDCTKNFSIYTYTPPKHLHRSL